MASMEHRQPEQNGGRGGCGTAPWGLDDRATWFVQEAQNLLVRNSMTDMSVCVIEDKTMYTIRYDKYPGYFQVWQLIFSTQSSPPNRCHRIVLASCSPFLKTLIETSPEDDVTLLLDDTSNHQMEHLISFIYTGAASLARRSDYCALVTSLETLGVSANPGEEEEEIDRDEGEEEGKEEERDLVVPNSTPLLPHAKLPSPSSTSSSPPTRELAPTEPHATVADATASADEEDLMLLCGSEGVRGGGGGSGAAADDDLSLRTLLLRLHQQPPSVLHAARDRQERHSHDAHKNADVNAAVDEDEHEEKEDVEDSQSNLLLSSSFWPSCNESWCPPPPPLRGGTDLFAEEREEQSHRRRRRSLRCRGDHEGNEDAEHVQSSFSTVDKSAILYCNADDGDAAISLSPDAANGGGGGGDNGSLMQSEGRAETTAPSPFSSPSPSSIGSSGVDENLPPASELDLIFNAHLDRHGDPAHVTDGRENLADAYPDAGLVEGKLKSNKDQKRRRQRCRSGSSESTHQCNHCRKRFASQHYLRFHESSVHTKTKSVSCDECSKTFTSVYYLKQHTIRMHSETRPFSW